MPSTTPTPADHRDSHAVAHVLRTNSDPTIARQGARLAAMLAARDAGTTSPSALRAIARSAR